MRGFKELPGWWTLQGAGRVAFPERAWELCAPPPITCHRKLFHVTIPELVIVLMVNSVSQKILVLVLQCGRIQAGQVVVVRNSFIVGKGKWIICSIGRKFALGQQKNLKGPWFVLGGFYTTLNLEMGIDYISLPGSNDHWARGRSWVWLLYVPMIILRCPPMREEVPILSNLL
jgi:hypothetical protein